MTLKDMIQACGFESVTPRFESYFSESAEREPLADTLLVEIDDPMSTQEVLNLLKSKGLRTATVYELLEFAVKNPDAYSVQDIVSFDGGPFMACNASVLCSTCPFGKTKRHLRQLPAGTRWFPFPHVFLAAPIMSRNPVS